MSELSKGKTRLRALNLDGFGNSDNLGIGRIFDAGDYMYWGTSNKKGSLVYRSKDKGENYELISINGLNGNILNEHVTTVVWFKNMLYIGTWQLKSGAQLFRANANAEKVGDIVWETLTEDGFGNMTNNGFTNGIIFDGYIYIGCFNGTEGTEVWRSKTGDIGSWEMCITKGFNREDNSDSTVMYTHNGYLYVCTESVKGEMTKWNGSALFRTRGGDGELVWEQVNPNGYGDIANNNSGAITYFDGNMYVGTWNYVGSQVWRSNMEGTLPWKWERVITGGFGDVNNHACQGLCVFNGDLYYGSVGALNLIPQSGKFLVTHDGINWEDANSNGMISGNVFGVIWMISSNDKLYIATIEKEGHGGLWVCERTI